MEENKEEIKVSIESQLEILSFLSDTTRFRSVLYEGILGLNNKVATLQDDINSIKELLNIKIDNSKEVKP